MHGRDEEVKDAIIALLKAIGVRVITSSNTLSELDLNKRDVWQAVRKGFERAHAAVILFTPDEVSFLRPELWTALDTPGIKGPRFQPRQNVLLELGYALHEWEDRTIYITVGNVDPPIGREGKWIAGIPGMMPKEFREHVAKMVQQVFSSPAILSKMGFKTDEFKTFVESIASRKKQWRNAGKIQAIYDREKQRISPSFIEAGLEVKASRFRYQDFFAQGQEFILTGTNFGDQMGEPGMLPGLLHNLVIQTLKRRSDTLVFLILAPFELLEMLHHNAIRDLRNRSAPRLKMLQHDPRLTSQERGRLHIFDHPGAMFLAAAIRDPDPTISNHGLVVVTPRWFKDETGPQRMFFAVEQRVNPEIFKTIIGPIYPSIKVDRGSMTGIGQEKLGGRSIDEICRALDTQEDPFTGQLSVLPLPGEEFKAH